LNSLDPVLMETIERYRTKIRDANGSAHIVYKEIADGLQKAITKACCCGKLRVCDTGTSSQTIITTTNSKTMCEYPIEILGFLSVVKPLDEEALLECVTIGNEFGAMFCELQAFANRTPPDMYCPTPVDRLLH